jgi:hypothetical protein
LILAAGHYGRQIDYRDIQTIRLLRACLDVDGPRYRSSRYDHIQDGSRR